LLDVHLADVLGDVLHSEGDLGAAAGVFAVYVVVLEGFYLEFVVVWAED
jgi:hypothetical protein